VKRLTVYEPVDFSEDSFTERGERVWKTLKIEVHAFGRPPLSRVLKCDRGIAITEEWIEGTIKDGFAALKRDFPMDEFTVERVKPNHIIFKYKQTKGPVN